MTVIFPPGATELFPCRVSLTLVLFELGFEFRRVPEISVAGYESCCESEDRLLQKIEFAVTKLANAGAQ
jgi:hypothetical protein